MISPADISEQAALAASRLRDELGGVPPVAVVLGTGWDVMADGLQGSDPVGFDSIPGFASPGVQGHNGTVRKVRVGDKDLLVQEGRLHYYEGISPLEACFPVWAYAKLGVRLLVQLSAAGGLNPAFMPGDLMIGSDHIMLLGANPLVGVPETEDRTRFVPGQGVYTARWLDELKLCLPAEARCERGVYAFVTGPSYETGAEATMLRMSGADAVGMSTTPEALTARYLGLETAAMVCISNSLIPPPGVPPSHGDVLESVRRTAAGLPGFLERLAARADMVM
jgi:purine-nucleoside phosphorylase